VEIVLKVLRFISWVIYAVLTFAIIVLAFGFVLLLFGANPEAGFTEFIYGAAKDFMDPFYNLIEPTKLANGGILYWSALIAIAAYLVIMWVVSLVMNWLSGRIYVEEQKDAAAAQAASQQPYSAPPTTPPAQQQPGAQSTPPPTQPTQPPEEPGQQ
jgi:hypothetical protein